MTATKFPIVEIEWEDIHGSSGMWMDKETIKEFMDIPYIVNTVGYLVAENDARICICMAIGAESVPEPVLEGYGAPKWIPRRSINSIRRLKRAGKMT